MGRQTSVAMQRIFVLLVAAGLVALAAGEATELTYDNFDAEVYGSGKGALVKFLAPW